MGFNWAFKGVKNLGSTGIWCGTGGGGGGGGWLGPEPQEANFFCVQVAERFVKSLMFTL